MATSSISAPSFHHQAALSATASSSSTASNNTGGGDPTAQDAHPSPSSSATSTSSSSSATGDSSVSSNSVSPASSSLAGSAMLVQKPESPSPTSADTPASPQASTSSRPHVDIVNYPAADLLRLLAALLEQIARANDALNQRASSTSGSQTPGVNPPVAPPPQPLPTPEGEQSEDAVNFQRGRFDAAPLNSPVTPGHARTVSRDGEYGMMDDDDDGGAEDQFPVTPGVDLLREVGALGGVEGFMPSLGGAHTPMPLARRRGASFQHVPNPPADPTTSLLTASSTALASPSATLCFHARNVPAISIEAYLLRILKYCPTTNEVFLSLLVYFDRMARVGLEAQRVGLTTPVRAEGSTEAATPPRLFAIDSFNVHRLVIAGVTVASKFFSDVFYTNSRYAKVGGLPLNELNQLELQFLLLNDFRLVIPLDELQRYADQLLIFWVGRGRTPAPPTESPPSIERPRSVRSQPSSSGTSVTSTITPGTPSTPRGSSSSTAGTASEDDRDDDDDDGGREDVVMTANGDD